MGQTPTLYMLYTCPFCWKVRGVIEHLGMDVDYVGVNGMKIKKEVAFAGDWGKVPVFTDEKGELIIQEPEQGPQIASTREATSFDRSTMDKLVEEK